MAITQSLGWALVLAVPISCVAQAPAPPGPAPTSVAEIARAGKTNKKAARVITDDDLPGRVTEAQPQADSKPADAAAPDASQPQPGASTAVSEPAAPPRGNCPADQLAALQAERAALSDSLQKTDSQLQAEQDRESRVSIASYRKPMQDKLDDLQGRISELQKAIAASDQPCPATAAPPSTAPPEPR